jgi:mxaL protein
LGLGLLLSALGLTLLALTPLSYPVQRDAYTHVAVVDITQSMNVEDYRLEGRAVSRLEYVKWNLRHALPDLPCGSKLGLAVFTERRPFLLFEPIEVCSSFAALDAAIAQLDWRMAWEADSRIADSLRKSMEAFATLGTLVFLSDGQEAPPINPRYRPDLQAYRGKAAGIIIGVGGLTPAPIPKFNAEGGREGFYRDDEVLQRSTFGLPEMAPDELEGYNARNNPFGNPKTGGTEHLSSLREDYLRQLSQETGLLYRRLETPESFRQALLEPSLAKMQILATDMRWLPAGLALLALLASYALPWLISTNPKPQENPHP